MSNIVNFHSGQISPEKNQSMGEFFLSFFFLSDLTMGLHQIPQAKTKTTFHHVTVAELQMEVLISVSNEATCCQFRRW